MEDVVLLKKEVESSTYGRSDHSAEGSAATVQTFVMCPNCGSSSGPSKFCSRCGSAMG